MTYQWLYLDMFTIAFAHIACCSCIICTFSRLVQVQQKPDKNKQCGAYIWSVEKALRMPTGKAADGH